MHKLLRSLVFCLFMFFLLGCQQSNIDEASFLDALVDVAAAVTVANTASVPVNPYAWPVGIGLAGVTAMLEALRRKERAGRKHAEHELNGNNKKP